MTNLPLFFLNLAGKSVCSVHSGQERDGGETHPRPKKGTDNKNEVSGKQLS